MEIVVTGLVQGVFYRATTRQEALQLGLTGRVRNMMVGSVHVLAEGEEEALRELVKWCRQGPSGAVVQRVDVEWLQYTGRFDTFSVES